MFIISKYKDYYDGVAGSVGIDKKIVFERKEQEIQLKRNEMFMLNHKLPWRDAIWSKPTKKEPEFSPFFIIFCGKLYVGYCFKWYEKINNFHYKEKIEFEYDKNKIFEKIEFYLAQKRLFNCTANIKEKKAKFYSKYDQLNSSEQFSNLCIQYKTPIITFSDKKIRSEYYSYDVRDKIQIININSKLNDFKFYKVFDAFNTFQELSMYIGNVLTNPETNIIEIDEKYRMTQRGMDKTSFRQIAPGQKKQQRKQNKLRKKNKNRP